MSALTLYNIVPHRPDTKSERLSRIGESRDTGTVGCKGGSGHHSDDDEDEDALCSWNTEEGTCESDRDDEEENSQ